MTGGTRSAVNQSKGSQRVGNMEDERLIVEVPQHEVIYVPNHPFYKDNVRKVWQLI